jgi:hypothetical protein
MLQQLIVHPLQPLSLIPKLLQLFLPSHVSHGSEIERGWGKRGGGRRWG